MFMHCMFPLFCIIFAILFKQFASFDLCDLVRREKFSL